MDDPKNMLYWPIYNKIHTKWFHLFEVQEENKKQLIHVDRDNNSVYL